MDRNDQQAIEGLFSKLAQVEGNASPRDPEAEAFIQDRISQQPAAPYYMAQTIVVQEQALQAAQQRIEELETSAARTQGGGGFLGGLFGNSQPPRSSVPRVGRAAMGAPAIPAGAAAQRGGGGFLAGAAQTAMGVAGGLLLGNMIGGMFAGDATAAEASSEDVAGGEDELAGADDMGGDDFGDMEF